MVFVKRARVVLVSESRFGRPHFAPGVIVFFGHRLEVHDHLIWKMTGATFPVYTTNYYKIILYYIIYNLHNIIYISHYQ